MLGTNILTGGVMSATGNVTGGNILTGGLISATGAITGANVTGSNILTAGLISATGNITGGNILGGANVNATTLTGTTVSVSANITGGNLLTGGLISATGAITGAAITGSSLTLALGTANVGNITNSNGNGIGNIGNSTVYFNTVFGKATTAQYADLAEQYLADADYEPGTVLVFGGSAEVTAIAQDADKRVAGVVSLNPAHLMNSGLTGDHVVKLALTGRVPTSVIGTVRKGDVMVAAGNGAARAEENPAVATVLGKSLEDFDGVSGIIEIVVGRV